MSIRLANRQRRCNRWLTLSVAINLVVGPILRARQILPQMHQIPVPTWNNVKLGCLLITAGVFKKTIAGKTWLLCIVLIILQALCLLTGEPSNEFIYFQF